MKRREFITLLGGAAAWPLAARAQTSSLFATTKVDENVYIFRYVRHQSMFVVTPEGVIATDPIGLRRPAAKTYIEEIRKITKATIKYVIYSHSHFDHIAGGQPFKDLGAVFVAHKNAKARIEALQRPDVVVPDEVVDTERTITLGDTTLELIYVGKNHSDSTLVMRLPKKKIIFTVDWIPLETVPFRGMADTYLPDIEVGLQKVIAMDWERLIPGHPGPDGRQIGTKEDARAVLAYLQDLSAAVKKAADEHKCLADAMRDIKLPKYEKWANYDALQQGSSYSITSSASASSSSRRACFSRFSTRSSALWSVRARLPGGGPGSSRPAQGHSACTACGMATGARRCAQEAIAAGVFDKGGRDPFEKSRQRP